MLMNAESLYLDLKKRVDALGGIESLEARLQKFALLADLGTITVPEDYDHATCLASFRKKNHKKFYFYNDASNDENYSNPSHKLVAGKKYGVKAFKQTVSGLTTSEERLAFLKTQNALLVGAQGLTQVFTQLRAKLPKGKAYLSMDEMDRLWQDADGYHGVPDLYADDDGGFRWYLGYFESPWRDYGVLLCFCDLD